ncbi:ferritin-like domain-containing protein [Desulfatibacillum aliphaticivorans]|uniref:ferritin-like domain-containing protein n=1 Tax=Desulfatibacillum aliphaticivorans TaxID=218208 RepID=UPI00042201F9|nr:ferritin family protein [Desulfatibacillum aliphaticivorans]
MTNFNSVDAILDFAIKNEQEAQKFYAEIAENTTRSGSKALFESFVAEEKRHEEKLKSVKEGQAMAPAAGNVTDLKIADYVVDAPVEPNMDFQKALILAMKKEKAAFMLYTHLANRVEGDLKEIFLSLAQEEAKHKLYFETEYDDHVLTDN